MSSFFQENFDELSSFNIIKNESILKKKRRFHLPPEVYSMFEVSHFSELIEKMIAVEPLEDQEQE
jgi:hypothetical protein